MVLILGLRGRDEVKLGITTVSVHCCSHELAIENTAVVTVTNILFAISAYLADFNHTHVLSPRWPPHAKFHNGQSMSFGALSALTALYLLNRPNPTVDAARDSVFLAAVVGSLTSVAGLSAILYPGTAWVDPEFDTGALAGPQVYVFVGQLVVIWSACFWERGRIGRKGKRG